MSNRVFHFLSFSLGALLLFHGIDKLINGVEFVEQMIMSYIPFKEYMAPCTSCLSFGVGFMGKMFIEPSISYSQYIVFVVYLGEVIAPLFLIFGRYVRIASLIIAIYMIISIIVIYRDVFFSLDHNGGWSIETPVLYLIMALTLMFGRKSK